MNILHDPVEGHSATIYVPLESYMYLDDICSKQRVGRTRKREGYWWDRLLRNFEDHGGKKQLMDGDMGGAIGDPENSWEEGRWTDWSVETMKRMLDEAGLPYEDGPEVEFIDL